MHKFALLTLGLLATQASFAQEDRSFDRANTWETSIQLINIDSWSAGGEGGSGIHADSAVGLGFGFAYNFTNHLALGFDLQYASPDYQASFVNDQGDLRTVRGESDFTIGQLRGTWNLLSGNFTPYVEGGLGWTYMDSNIIDGLPDTGCWWDPWWGYICVPFYDTYDETSFSWSAGAGVRWDIGQAVFRAGYTWMNIDNGGVAADPDPGVIRVELAWRFGSNYGYW